MTGAAVCVRIDGGDGYGLITEGSGWATAAAAGGFILFLFTEGERLEAMVTKDG